MCVWHLARLVDAALTDLNPGLAGAVYQTIRSPLGLGNGGGGPQAQTDASADTGAEAVVGAGGFNETTTNWGPLLLKVDVAVASMQQGPDGRPLQGDLVPHSVPLHVGQSVRAACTAFCLSVLPKSRGTTSQAGVCIRLLNHFFTGA